MPRRNNTRPHTRYAPVDNCSTKKRYPSEHAAVAAAHDQMLLSPTLDLSVYQCPHCAGWHLTRQAKNTSKT